METVNSAKWLLRNSPDPSQDRPIEQDSDDLLDRAPFVASLARALVRDTFDDSGKLVSRRSTGFVVGLTGPWGLGKSSVVNLLSHHLGTQDRVIIVNFNPWLFNGRDELLSAFFNSLKRSFEISKFEAARDLVLALDRYRGAIEFTAKSAAALADFKGFGGVASSTVSGILSALPRRKPKMNDLSSIETERRNLEKKLKNLDAAVVVLIDELDRVEDDEIRAVAQMIKAIGDIKGISYLVAYDPNRVAEALGRGSDQERIASGNLYLEKIIQHQIPMRPLFAEDVEKLLSAALNAHKSAALSNISETDSNILDAIKAGFDTPREVKRLISSFSVIEEAVRGEVNPIHVLGYCWLLTKAPNLRMRISGNPDIFVDDPAEKEIYRRAGFRSNSRDKLSDDAILGAGAQPFEEILKQLFPRFGENSRKHYDGTRISRRQNLLRVLYLGNPPGLFSRSTIEDVWELPIEEMRGVLRDFADAGTITGFLDRADDLLPHLSESGDANFWQGLSRALLRHEDWITKPEIERAAAEDASTSLYHLGVRDRSNLNRVKTIVEDLISSGDLIIVPWLLRKHMFRHGMVEDNPARSGDSIYTSEETASLLTREADRYRDALNDGTLLRRVPSVEALFVLVNSGNWDFDLRRSLTTQIETRDAIYTFAALLTPPGFIIETKTLATLVDLDHLKLILSTTNLPEDPWLSSAFKRMRMIANGRDPTFAEDDG